MTESVGVLVMLALAALLIGGIGWIHRKLSPRPAAATPEPSDPVPRTVTRIPLRFGVAVLLMLVIATAIVVLIPWTIAARELGGAGLLASALFAAPVLGGLLHAASRGPVE